MTAATEMWANECYQRALKIERLTAERDAALAKAAMWDGIQRGTYDAMTAEVERLRAVESAARALKFAAYPAHGTGFVMTVTGGNINDLDAALAACQQKTVNSEEGK